MIENNIKIELIHSGDVAHESYHAVGFYRMPLLRSWPAVREMSERGEYRWGLYNKSGDLISTGGFTPLFAKWQATQARLDPEAQSNFRECLFVPHVPEAQVVIERRGTIPPWHRVAVLTLPREIDEVFLPRGVQVHALRSVADPARALNLMIVSEGYGYKEQELFLDDARRTSALLLALPALSAYASAGKISVTALLKPVRFGGIPFGDREDTTNTNFDVCQGALGQRDLIAVRDPHALQEAIGTLPCDMALVLCNSEAPGGSGLYNQYMAVPGRLPDAELGPLLAQYLAGVLADATGDDAQTALAAELALRLPLPA